MITEALFTRAKTWKQPKCPWMDKRTKKTWSIYIMAYYLAKRKPFSTILMNLEVTVLSEIRQTKTDRYYMSSLICRV